MWDLLTPSELAWKRTCRDFAEQVIGPRAADFDRDNRFPREVHDAAHEAGLMNVAFPTPLGGRGLSARTVAVGGEELAAACSPTAFSIGFNHGALRPVLLGGTDAQERRFVAELIERRGYASLCLTEPAASGSNLMALGTRAVKTGAGWSLTGTKCMVGNGTEAELFLVLASAVEAGEPRGLTFFAVPRDAGVKVGPNTDKLGFRCVTTPTIELDGVEVSDEHRIGPVGGAEAILLPTLDYIRFGGGSVILGIVVGALRELQPWLERRRVYPGEPLAAKDSVQMLLAGIFCELRQIRLMLWRAADLLDAGKPFGLEAAMTKLAASRLAVRATSDILQLHGWRGIDAEYGIHKRYRDARVTTIYEGTSEVQLLNLYRELRHNLEQGGDL